MLFPGVLQSNVEKCKNMDEGTHTSQVQCRGHKGCAAPFGRGLKHM